MSHSNKFYKQVILFGDSMTQICNPERGFSFHAQLAYYYTRKLDVINRGLSGFNTRQALKVLPGGEIVPQPESAKVVLMTVFFGANDACLPDRNDKYCQHVDLVEYKENLRKILQYPKEIGQKPERILIAPPPIHELMLEEFDRKNGRKTQRTAEHTKEYSEAAKKVGAELGIPVIDLKSAFEEACDWPKGKSLIGSRKALEDMSLEGANMKYESLFTDGLHLSPAGNRIVFNKIIKVIEKNFPHLINTELTPVIPPWNDDSWHK